MRLKKVNLKRVLCALLASAMVVVPVTPASAATARATTMKLEKAEGSVTLKTQNGSARKITNGMRLYNGNALSTASSSYAYISLDSTKAVKLDQNSSATLRQNGQQLELLVKSGKMFFNVSQPLTEKENMNVRTSTMVTGIRGTCGVVEYVNVNKSRLYLLEGKVTLGSGENATTIYGGQTATVILQPKKESGGTDQPGESDKPGDTDKPDKEVEQKVLVEKMTEKTVPVFAIAEIVSDPVLQKKITKTTDLKIEKLEEILEESRQEEEEKAPEEPTSSGGGSSTPSTPVVTDATLTGNVSAAAINAALATYNKVTIAADAKAELEADVKIPEGKVLLVNSEVASNSGKINVGDGTMITTTNVASNVVSDNSALLCTCTSGSTDGSSVYASTLNVQVAEYLNGLAQTSAVTATFKNNASVKANISLSGYSTEMVLNMGTHSLTLESGTLSLNSNVGITGSGTDPTVHLNGGNLVMQGTSTSQNAVISNNGGGYAIKHTSGTVKWTDKGMRVKASGAVNNSASYAIQGTTLKDDQLTAIVPSSYVTIADGGLEWNTQGTGMLAYIPSKFDSLSGLISALRINAALQAYPTVTVGVGLTLNLNDTITIPAGKTLNIESKVTQTGSDQFSGGFTLMEGSQIVLEDGATLNVSGGILGNGTINVGTGSGTSKAKMEVANGGLVLADTINLCSTSELTNNGTIDGKNIVSTGGASVKNYDLIKLTNGAYTSQNSGKDTYTGSTASALISDYESTAIKQHALMFATHVSNDTVKQCYYASSINDLVVKYMNELTKETTDATIKWVFKNNVLVPAGKDITLTNFSADTGIYALQVAGDLTLTNIGTITGSGTAVISLQGTGTLTLDRTIETSGTISNTNYYGENHYAIAVSSSSNPIIIWNDDKLQIQSVKASGTNSYIIEGCNTTEDSDCFVKDWLKCKENYSVKAEKGVAILVPVEQQSGSGS